MKKYEELDRAKQIRIVLSMAEEVSKAEGLCVTCDREVVSAFIDEDLEDIEFFEDGEWPGKQRNKEMEER